MHVTPRMAVLGGVLALALTAIPAQAQRPGARIGRFEIPGLDFSPDGAWRRRTAQIRANRRAMLRNGAIGALNARSAAAANVVTGTFNVPVILIQFKNLIGPFPLNQYQDVLFNPAPVTRPYSVKTYFEETSNGLITMNGVVFDWASADTNDFYYEDGCNGIGISSCAHPLANGASSRFRDLVLEILGKVDDGSVDWGQFDNDGPDGVPNSSDDDGRVDFVTFVQADVDGACGTVHIWAHRWSVSSLSLGGMYQTKTPRTGGGFIFINDYTMQSGQGGNGACSSGQIMPIGTVTHETGHAFGLPDLYDTSLQTEGIGEWGIMGSGNYSRPYSPSGYEAWSLAELGWVTVDTLQTSQTVTLNPVQTSDTVLYIPVPTTDEYYLLENRDSLLSDTAQMNVAFGSGKKNPGLLIWHIDQGQVTTGSFGNSVNVGSVQGVALEQADGFNQLRTPGGNRGDAGDSYPGSTVNRGYAFSTNPAAKDNQGAYAGFIIDSIYRVASGMSGVPSPMVFRFVKRARSVITTDRAGAVVRVNGLSYTRFDDVIPGGDQVDLDVTTSQMVNFGRSQLMFLSWSDGLATTHSFTSTLAKPDTVTASFSANHRVNVTAPTGGTVTADVAGNLVTGIFVQEGVPVTLTATPSAGGTFVRYQGDTTTTNATLRLPMGRPYSLSTVFSGNVAVNANDAVNALLGAACNQTPCLNAQQLTYLDQTGNNDGVYNLGDFLSYADRNGLNTSSPLMQKVLSQPTMAVPIPATPSPRKEQ